MGSIWLTSLFIANLASVAAVALPQRGLARTSASTSSTAPFKASITQMKAFRHRAADSVLHRPNHPRVVRHCTATGWSTFITRIARTSRADPPAALADLAACDRSAAHFQRAVTSSNVCIDAVCKLDYPREKLDIQVLDDSTDETMRSRAALRQNATPRWVIRSAISTATTAKASRRARSKTV